MTVSFAELEHSTFEMSRYISQESVRDKTVTSNPENSRFSAVPAKSPRTSIIAAFFSEIPKLATRVLTAIKGKWESLKQRANALGLYRGACNESIKSLKLALDSNNIKDVCRQLKNFCDWRKKQIGFLDAENPASAKGFENGYHQRVKQLLEPSLPELKASLSLIPDSHKTRNTPELLIEEAKFIKSMLTLLIKYAESPDSHLIPASRDV